jgi:hypothetical protein
MGHIYQVSACANGMNLLVGKNTQQNLRTTADILSDDIMEFGTETNAQKST